MATLEEPERSSSSVWARMQIYRGIGERGKTLTAAIVCLPRGKPSPQAYFFRLKKREAWGRDHLAFDHFAVCRGGSRN